MLNVKKGLFVTYKEFLKVLFTKKLVKNQAFEYFLIKNAHVSVLKIYKKFKCTLSIILFLKN